jgi:hypothetical protein
MDLRSKIEVAVEAKLIEHDVQLRKVLNGELECAGSSRVRADEIVDMVIRMQRGEEVEYEEPWRHFAVGKPTRKR